MIIKIKKNFLKILRNIFVGDYRSKLLSEIIVKMILKYPVKSEVIRIMDYGSGFQPKFIHFVYKKLKHTYNKNVIIYCYDVYNSQDLEKLNQNKDIIFNKIENIDLDKTNYDFCLLSDVLHHIGVEKVSELKNLINNLQNKAKFVLIKDHYQYGYFSNYTLRVMDFLGNYFNNVKTPRTYFTKKSFKYLLQLTNSTIVEEILNIKLYQSYFLFMSNPKFNFIYLIKKYRKE
jgi:hypothetical protein